MDLPPPLPPSSAPETAPAPTACVNCGSIHFSTQTKLPVCEPCRVALVKFPFPLWVRVASAVVAILVLVSLAMSQERIAKRLHVTHAKKLLDQQRWEDAYQAYHGFIAQHGDTKTLLNYAEAATNSGHLQEAAQTMQKLSGRSISWVDLNRAKAIDSSRSTAGLARSVSGGLPAVQLNSAPIQLQPSGQLSGFQLQPTPSGSGTLNLNNAPIRLQTR